MREASETKTCQIEEAAICVGTHIYIYSQALTLLQFCCPKLTKAGLC